MQTAGKKERSAMDNSITMNTITETQRAQLNTHMFSAMLLNVLIKYGYRTIYEKCTT